MHPRAIKFYKYIISASLVLACVFIFASGVGAAINPMLKFQGKVTELDGSELADGVYNMSFGLYTAPTGGAAIWSEDLTAAAMFSGTIANTASGASTTVITYAGAAATGTLAVGQYLYNADSGEAALIVNYNTGANTIEVVGASLGWSNGENINNRPFVEGGVIDVNLGAVSDLSAVDFNRTLYLEVTFNGETMLPRKLLTAEASAFEAARLGGKTGDEFAALTEDESVTGQWSFNNILSIASSSASTALTVTQNGSGNIVDFAGATSTVSVLSDGRFRIGDYTFPASRAGAPSGYVLKIDASGNLSWANDIAGSGGGSDLWASSTQALHGVYVYQSDTGHKVVIGNNALTGPVGLQFEVHGLSWLDTVGISAGQELRLYDSDSSNYAALKATGTIASNFILSLPGGYGLPGQALLTGENGNLYWGAPTGFVYVNPGAIGQTAYYAAGGSALSATSSIFIDTNQYVGVGTSSPWREFSVDGWGAFESGLCIGGDCRTSWTAVGAVSVSGIPGAGEIAYWVDASTLAATSTLGVNIGGTGTTTWAANSLVFAFSDNVLSEILPGPNGYALVMQGGSPTWASTSPGSTHDLLSAMHSDTTPGVVVRGDIIVGQGALAAWTRLALGSNGYVLYSDGTDANWSSYENLWAAQMSATTTDALGQGLINKYYSTLLFAADLAATTTDALSEGAANLYYTTNRFAADLAATSTDALQQGLNNLYWSNALFDARFVPSLAGTTSLPNLTDLVNLASVGTITSGVWHGTPIEVGYGGTGTTTFQANSLVFASSDNVLSEILPGPNGYALVMQGNIPTWASTSPGSTHDLLSAMHTDTTPGVVVRGDIIVGQGVAPTWIRLALGSNGYVLYSDGTDANWSSYENLWAAQMSATTTDALGQGLINKYYSTLLFAADLAATSTDALQQGSTNLYWSDALFDARFVPSLAATTSLANLTDLVNLASVGTITSGLWHGTPIEVGYGGTGTTTWESGSLVYASSDNILSEVLAGENGQTLVMSGGRPIWAASTTGAAHDILSVAHLNTDATSTLERGDILVVKNISGSNKWSRMALGPAGYILYSDGADAGWSTTTIITALGTITTGVWHGTPIEIGYGGTGATNTADAVDNLGLTNVSNYGINSSATSGWVWIADGDGSRGHWAATGTLGIAAGTGGNQVSKFVGTTTLVTNGSFSTSTLVGYEAANAICDYEYPGSHFCRTYDMLVTIEQGDISAWGAGTQDAWIAEGPPGYTVNSNDCNGWTDGTTSYLGAFWLFKSNGGGAGYMINCAQTKRLACCSWQ